LHHADFVQFDLAQLAGVAVPGFIGGDKANRHAAQIATLGKGDHVTRRCGVGQAQFKPQALGILGQLQRT